MIILVFSKWAWCSPLREWAKRKWILFFLFNHSIVKITIEWKFWTINFLVKESKQYIYRLIKGVVGTQNLAPKVLALEFYYNDSHNLNTNKQQVINIPQWETQAVDFFDHWCYNYNYRHYFGKLSCSRGDTLSISLSFYFYYSPYIDFSSSPKKKIIPFLHWTFLLFIGLSTVPTFIAVILPA